MKVYVLERGEYEQEYIVGVYASLDAAKAEQGDGWEVLRHNWYHPGNEVASEAHITEYELRELVLDSGRGK